MSSPCTPQQTQCDSRGLQWYDWAGSIFDSLCKLIGWNASISDNTSVAPFGKQVVLPTFKSVSVSASVQQVSIPAGALVIKASVDNASAITVVQSSGSETLPIGEPFELPFLSPVYKADTNGQDVTQGHGAYPQTFLSYPIGASGMVQVVYTDTVQPIVVTTL